jgi:hypothetical protein
MSNNHLRTLPHALTLLHAQHVVIVPMVLVVGTITAIVLGFVAAVGKLG